MASWKETKKDFFMALANITEQRDASSRNVLTSTPVPHTRGASSNASDIPQDPDPTRPSSLCRSSLDTPPAPVPLVPLVKRTRSPSRHRGCSTNVPLPLPPSLATPEFPVRSRHSSPCTTSSSPASPPAVLPTIRRLPVSPSPNIARDSNIRPHPRLLASSSMTCPPPSGVPRQLSLGGSSRLPSDIARPYTASASSKSVKSLRPTFTPQLRSQSSLAPNSTSSNARQVRPHTSPATTSMTSIEPQLRPHTSPAPTLAVSSTSKVRPHTSPTRTMATSNKRSKPSRKLKTRPEQPQIFAGLKFFFIRDHMANPFQRRRVEFAIDHGVVHAQTLTRDVTHVIVDSDLDRLEVWKHYGKYPGLETSIIVNEKWMSECFLYKEIRQVRADRFQVKGAPSPEIPASSEEPPPEHGNDGNKRTQKSPGSSNSLPQQRPPDELTDIMTHMIQLGGQKLETDETPPGSTDSSFQIPSENAGFRCMERNDGSRNDNPNARTIEILQQMATVYDEAGDQWRSRAYRQAISALRKQEKKITTKQEAQAVPLIGDRLAEKIEEIVRTDHLKRLEYAQEDTNHQLLRLFRGIYGVGVCDASRWIAQGYRTLEELKSNPELKPNQRIGLEHHDDFQQRIPRAEVEKLAIIVRNALTKADPLLQMFVGGSYRRGAPNSGDIDIVITKTHANMDQIRRVMTREVIPRLFRRDFLKIALAAGDDREGSKWHGACALPDSSVWRRIDLLFVPWAELGAAMIYFTGNDIFNRSVRLLASKKGMRLNQHGLYRDVLRGPNRIKVTEGTLVEGHDEKKIFQHLGVPFWEPHERQC